PAAASTTVGGDRTGRGWIGSCCPEMPVWNESAPKFSMDKWQVEWQSRWVAKQLAMGFMKGRKKRPRKTVAHRKRPVHDGRHPVHITLRVRRDVPNLRGYKVAQIIGRLMRA